MGVVPTGSEMDWGARETTGTDDGSEEGSEDGDDGSADDSSSQVGGSEDDDEDEGDDTDGVEQSNHPAASDHAVGELGAATSESDASTAQVSADAGASHLTLAAPAQGSQPTAQQEKQIVPVVQEVQGKRERKMHLPRSPPPPRRPFMGFGWNEVARTLVGFRDTVWVPEVSAFGPQWNIDVAGVVAWA